MNPADAGEGKEKWYFKRAPLIIGFICVGPLILPLVWSNPRFSGKKKAIISAVVVILTFLLTVVTFFLFSKLIGQGVEYLGS